MMVKTSRAMYSLRQRIASSFEWPWATQPCTGISRRQNVLSKEHLQHHVLYDKLARQNFYIAVAFHNYFSHSFLCHTVSVICLDRPLPDQVASGPKLVNEVGRATLVFPEAPFLTFLLLQIRD